MSIIIRISAIDLRKYPGALSQNIVPDHGAGGWCVPSSGGAFLPLCGTAIRIEPTKKSRHPFGRGRLFLRVKNTCRGASDSQSSCGDAAGGKAAAGIGCGTQPQDRQRQGCRSRGNRRKRQAGNPAGGPAVEKTGSLLPDSGVNAAVAGIKFTVTLTDGTQHAAGAADGHNACGNVAADHAARADDAAVADGHAG